MIRSFLGIIGIIFLSLFSSAQHGAAQSVFVPGSSQNSSAPIFLPQNTETNNQPLFLDRLYTRTGQVTYNPYAGPSRIFKPGQKEDSGLSHKHRMAQSLIETQQSNFEMAMRENERIQREIAANQAREAAAYNRLNPAQTTFAPQVFTPQAAGGQNADGKKVIRVYKDNSALEKPKPVFNSVR